MSSLKTQVGGDHYKDMAIQPIQFIQANKLGFCEGNIVKYVTRHAAKGGAEDLRKVIHYAQLLLELEYQESAGHESEPAHSTVSVAPQRDVPRSDSVPLGDGWCVHEAGAVRPRSTRLVEVILASGHHLQARVGDMDWDAEARGYARVICWRYVR